jgi:hypothetical protein
VLEGFWLWVGQHPESALLLLLASPIGIPPVIRLIALFKGKRQNGFAPDPAPVNRDQIGVIADHEARLHEGGRRISALEVEVHGLRNDFADHRGDVRARLTGLEVGQRDLGRKLDTGQMEILAELRKRLGGE